MLNSPLSSLGVAPETAGGCRSVLGEALGDWATGLLGEPVSVLWTELDRPRWVPTERSFAWVAPVDLIFKTEDKQATVRLEWPVPWFGSEAGPCPVMAGKEPASPGVHAGFYVGRPLTLGWGLRLKPGLHFIPRPSARGWRVDVAVAPLLGQVVSRLWRDSDRSRAGLYGALTGELKGRYWGQSHAAQMLDCLGLQPGADVTALEHALKTRVAEIVAAPESEPRRTAAVRSRLFGGDEVFAELLFQRVGRLVRRPGSRGDGATIDLADVSARVERAGERALTELGRAGGRLGSVLGPVGVGTTLARVEESARACFVGFRALGKVRGRADLRDLEHGWRGVLCPVQTPESTDVGLVRFTTVGVRCDMPQDLAEWFDLSASAALIPFINHDDPARASIGSKNLKQAVPVTGCEPPLVATGWERVLGSAEGVVRAPESGNVIEISSDFVTLENQRGQCQVAFGAPWQVRSGIDNTWTLAVSSGERVSAGQILAHAPEVRMVEGSNEADLCLGVNALVALTPWHGLNYEDGVVVSESFAERMSSMHLVRFDEAKGVDDTVSWWMEPGSSSPVPVESGETLLVIQSPQGVGHPVTAPVAGDLLGAFVDERRGSVAVLMRVRRRLAVGDKLTNRHQGKGVVSAVLPDAEMPRLPDGTPVEVILNPVGILRRLNVGQLWEMHTGLAAMLGEAQQVRVGRQIEDPRELGETLERLGAPRGRLSLKLPDGSLLGGTDGVVVGPQYMIKLNHLAADKVSVRGEERSVSPVSGQPAQQRCFQQSRWVGAAQRLGEMEVWALEAAGAKAVLADALQDRSTPVKRSKGHPHWSEGKSRASLRSVQAHLAVAGIELRIGDGLAGALQELSRQDVTALTPAWRLEGSSDVLQDLPELPNWRELGKWEGQQPQLDLLALLATAESNELHPRSGAHPLYDPDVHGQPGSPESEQVRYAIPLPAPMRHPWASSQAPVHLNSIPVLPPAYRVLNSVSPRGLDRAYRELAVCLLEYESQVSKNEIKQAKRTWAKAVSWVRAILGELEQPAVDSMAARLAGKRGLLRRFLLGQSVTHSGRSVIVPDPQLLPSQVGLPLDVARGLGVSSEPLGDVVLINRQPSLHPYNIVAQHAVEVDGDAIHLHPIVLTGLAGDFDGDTVAVHRPLSHPAREEALRRFHPASTLRSAASGAVLAKMDLDIALGLYLASSPQHPLFAQVRDLAGSDRLDSSALPSVVDKLVAAEANRERALEKLAALERTGWEAATGWSVGALDLMAAGRGSQLAEAMAVGAAGGDRAVSQLLDKRGRVVGAHPHTPSVDVQGCFLTGLSDDDFFGTAPGALASLAEKKLTSPHAGALTKTLVEIADTVVVSQARCDMPDHLRSPLTCASTGGPCQACYGTDPSTGEQPELGRRVGVLAAMLVGERSTQLSMKVFHAGGEAGALDSKLGELKSLFGDGRSASAFGTDAKGVPLNLRAYLATQGDLSAPAVRLEALQPLVEYGASLLGKVDQVHVAVLMRELVDTFLDVELLAAAPKGNTSLTSCAQRRGRSMFEVATARGSLQWLLRPQPEPTGGVRTKLAAGVPS